MRVLQFIRNARKQKPGENPISISCCIILLSVLCGASVLTGCGTTDGEPLNDPGAAQSRATVTAHTTRLPGSSPQSEAIAITQTVYAATREENGAGAVIITPPDLPTAFMAMHRVTHMPVNAPLLYTESDGTLSAATLAEMKRLRPDGVLQDGRTQVYAVGDIPEETLDQIRDQLGYKLRVLRASGPVELAELLDRWQAALKSDHPDEVVISAIDHPDGIAHGIGAMGWNAHMGRGFAWVYHDSIPEATRTILKRRLGGCYIYLTGGPEIISEEVEAELGQYGLVRRIAGTDIYSSNTVNAGYKDYGRNFGWWWNWEPRAFGWGISQSGHNVIIGSSENLLGIIPSVVLGHMGKHGPLLLVEPDHVPESVRDYLEMIRPSASGPTGTILNHAWIIGDEVFLSKNVQREIDQLLTPAPLRHAAKGHIPDVKETDMQDTLTFEPVAEQKNGGGYDGK